MRSIVLVLGVGLVVTASGCTGRPTALEACGKLQAAGEVSRCAEHAPSGLTAVAKAGAEGSLPSVAGKACGIYQFADAASFDQVVASFQGAAALVGPHRYGNKNKLIFVQCNDGLDAAHGAKVKAVVDAL